MSGYEQLKKHEGFTPRLKADRTEGGKKLNNRVIGYGYNVDAADDARADLIASGVPEGEVQGILEGKQKISKEHANTLFDISFRRSEKDAADIIPNFPELDRKVQGILTNMTYQVGRSGMRKFKKMREAIAAGEFDRAAKELLNSTLATSQTPNRANELAKQLNDYHNTLPKKEDAPKPPTPEEAYRKSLVSRLNKTYSRQQLVDRLSGLVTTMTKPTTEQSADVAVTAEGKQ